DHHRAVARQRGSVDPQTPFSDQVVTESRGAGQPVGPRRPAFRAGAERSGDGDHRSTLPPSDAGRLRRRSGSSVADADWVGPEVGTLTPGRLGREPVYPPTN